MMKVNELVQRYKLVLIDYYDTRLKELVLYGSTVHNQSDPNSDIDLLVLLHSLLITS